MHIFFLAQYDVQGIIGSVRVHGIPLLGGFCDQPGSLKDIMCTHDGILESDMQLRAPF